VVSIVVHDANSSNTTFTLTTGGTQTLTADVFDSLGNYVKPTLTWGSSNPAAVTVTAGTTGNNPSTLTGAQPGTASITATCSNPNCNLNLDRSTVRMWSSRMFQAPPQPMYTLPARIR
jgi:hypothetical protein